MILLDSETGWTPANITAILVGAAAVVGAIAAGIVSVIAALKAQTTATKQGASDNRLDRQSTMINDQQKQIVDLAKSMPPTPLIVTPPVGIVGENLIPQDRPKP